MMGQPLWNNIVGILWLCIGDISFTIQISGSSFSLLPSQFLYIYQVVSTLNIHLFTPTDQLICPCSNTSSNIKLDFYLYSK